jgi:hypothetical protein
MARTLIEKGDADWLKYERDGKVLENRTVLVLTADYVEKFGKRCDAMRHKLWLSLTSFETYHFAPHEPPQSGIADEIEACRLATIRERKTEISANRKHRVRPKGAAPDSDAPTKEVVNGEAIGGFNQRGKADRRPKEVRFKDGTASAHTLGGGEAIDRRTFKSPEKLLDSKGAVREAAEREIKKEERERVEKAGKVITFPNAAQIASKTAPKKNFRLFSQRLVGRP